MARLSLFVQKSGYCIWKSFCKECVFLMFDEGNVVLTNQHNVFSNAFCFRLKYERQRRKVADKKDDCYISFVFGNFQNDKVILL